MYVNAEYGNFRERLSLIITDAVVGKWLKPIGAEIQEILQVNASTIRTVLEEFSYIFSKELGIYNNGPPISFDIHPDVEAVMTRSRRMHFKLISKIDDELHNILDQGVLETTSSPNWFINRYETGWNNPDSSNTFEEEQAFH